MPLETLALIVVIIGGVIWLAVMLMGIVATFPIGLPALLVLLVAAYFLYRVVKERLGNAEDDYYDKNIKQ